MSGAKKKDTAQAGSSRTGLDEETLRRLAAEYQAGLTELYESREERAAALAAMSEEEMVAAMAAELEEILADARAHKVPIVTLPPTDGEDPAEDNPTEGEE